MENDQRTLRSPSETLQGGEAGPEARSRTPAEPEGRLYGFGPFRLDPDQRLLFRGGEVVPLAPRAFDTLLVLVERHGLLVTKEELLDRVWGDTIVEEANLAQNVFVVRKALGEGADGERYIETFARRGYRFVAPVETIEGTEARAGRPPAAEEGGEQAPRTDPADRDAAGDPTALGGERHRWVRAALAATTAALALAALTALVVLRTGGPPHRPEAAAGAEGLGSLAVLPFRPLGSPPGSPDPAASALELGMADALITRLSNLRHVAVRSTSQVARYAGAELDPVAAGRELGVDSVVEGRVQRAGDRVRVTVQLVSTGDGRPLWGESFEAGFADLFAIQDSISRQVAEALTEALTQEERSRLVRHPTGDMEAYELYLEGRFYALHLVELERAIELFERAMELDPEYALAHSGLAFAHSQTNDLIVPPVEANPRARRAALRALELDPALTEARTVLATVLWQYDWNLPAAEEQFRRALAIRPDDPWIHTWFSFALAAGGRLDEALAEVERARALDPADLEARLNLGLIRLWRREFPAAEAALRELVEREPSFWLGHLLLGRALEGQGRLREAIAEYRRARELDRVSPEPWMDLGRALARAGERAEAEEILVGLVNPPPGSYVAPFQVAMVHLGLGDLDQAFAWLEKAYEARSWYLTWLGVAPELDPLRADPRYDDLVRRVGLATGEAADR